MNIEKFVVSIFFCSRFERCKKFSLNKFDQTTSTFIIAYQISEPNNESLVRVIALVASNDTMK